MARSAARCSTGWWVGPSSPRPMELWVITWMTRMPISAPDADRRAAVVGETEEGAGIGDDAAVQRHAVHRRGHAVFAHAVVDVAAGVVGRVEGGHVLGDGVVRAGEVGRAADHLRHRRDQRLQRRARPGAGGVVGRLGRQLVDVGGERHEGVLGQVAAHQRARTRRGPDAPSAGSPRPARARAAAAGAPPGVGDLVGDRRTAARSSPWRCAPRRSPCRTANSRGRAGRPPSARRPCRSASCRRPSTGRSCRFAQASARRTWPTSLPSIAFTAQPAALKRIDLVAGLGDGRARRRW